MKTFEKNIIGTYQEKGRSWLAGLPKQVEHLTSLWNLKNLQPLDNLSYNYILSGYQEEKPIILKLSLDQQSVDREAKALETFEGFGAVSVIEHQGGALLLKRAIPGHQLKGQLPKEKAIKIACRMMEQLHRAPLPKIHNFPYMKDWLSALDKEWGLPTTHQEKARMLKNQLLITSRTTVLLHGDLHQENILSHGDGWLVIDPKGVVGDPINEIWACVENPEHDLNYISNYFNYTFDRAAKWYYVHLVLAACWQVEDGLDPSRFVNLAQSALPLINF